VAFLRRPGMFCLAMAAYFAVVLWVDRYVDTQQQLLLGAATWAVLLVACRGIGPERVAQVALVVVAATCTEVVGSILWGVYEYRLGNLPAFVPPGHGLVYLAGVSMATLCASRRSLLLLTAAAAAGAWGIAGLVVLPATDVAGAIGCAFLLLVFARTRQPVYAGVFVVVAVLELYGTALGTWTWEATVPGLGLSQGNPPSGVASGYVVFDVLALSLTAWTGGLWKTKGPRLRGLFRYSAARRPQSS
jgi:hypothetical protein